MAEETAAPEVSTSGSETTPAVDQGQAQGTTQQEPTTEAIFDPVEFDRITKSLPPELQTQATALRKSLQGDYTKKTQELAKNRQKIEAYDAFYKDPASQLQQMAQQLGYRLTRAEAEAAAEQSEWEPKSWDEVTQKIQEGVLKQLNPLFSEFQNMKKSAIENQLTELDPTWRQYEGKMVESLRTHPSLAKDPALLYRISVPPEVLESRATQRALQRFEEKTQAGKMSAGSTTTKTPKTGLPDSPVSFADAVKAAKALLEEQGIRPS